MKAMVEDPQLKSNIELNSNILLLNQQSLILFIYNVVENIALFLNEPNLAMLG